MKPKRMCEYCKNNYAKSIMTIRFEQLPNIRDTIFECAFCRDCGNSITVRAGVIE